MQGIPSGRAESSERSSTDYSLTYGLTGSWALCLEVDSPCQKVSGVAARGRNAAVWYHICIKNNRTVITVTIEARALQYRSKNDLR